ncbi:hypothetical protein QE197_25810 (plasmid) [Arsenophonus nasoniae]|uniref:Phage transcriptional regulator n=2 Tax=Arsenophonus nasoniae TaxID=638 RepID=A0A4P7L269_9GAMM|nr:hypothetical protein [Arsenophonus nasoniae]QBY46817.1 hypothetical protein ArsFIN_54280 [Arsenophonus nasoniae]WGM08892.1 hypothetical protein QE258_26675 [Arsenophonus nasoniae]WGM13922.1 hypothetical protein QE197_25810 [Arsenophonus nasoniae]WGM18217.1 hypothetical protein QE193_23720 [Arsenophonus nasoniae]
MSRKAKYQKAYIDDVINLSLVKGKVSNHFIAKWLHVDEKTVRNWRKDYCEFDHAFHHAADILKKEIAETARQNTKMRTRKIIKKTPDGETTTIEEVLPSHNDIAVYKKMGINEVFFNEEKQQQKEYLRSILERKKTGEMTSLEAAQFLEGEGIAVPKTLLLEVLDQLKRPISFEKDEAAKIDVSNFTVDELKSLMED